jgi:transcriptional regulator with XRE-family HTH domain
MPAVTAFQIDPYIVSATVGASVRVLRHSLDISREELSARCTELGKPLSAGVLLNIESGRVTGGRHRREVTVDELVMFAMMFNVSLSSLLDGSVVASDSRRRAEELRTEADQIERDAQNIGGMAWPMT